MATSRPYRAPTPPLPQPVGGKFKERMGAMQAQAERLNICRMTVLVVGSLVLFMLFHLLAKVSPPAVEVRAATAPSPTAEPSLFTASPDTIVHPTQQFSTSDSHQQESDVFLSPSPAPPQLTPPPA
eukprot:TRINITY_DN17101_c0_g1_i1.p1 TRINITY_DN17101_c0_g1~~TRINITY_DN17101_c0_g1_i1.p1  ORF type:complete len:144 (+),score=9.18 TRINITY_DN17101_c0_g1_i1:55-432(+)